MPLYSDEELKDFPEFESLEEALKQPEKVLRLRAYGHEDAKGLARIVELKKLQSLSITLSDVSKVLPRLGELQDLQSISLQACQVSTFPEGILSLKHLRSLAIGNNQLTVVPDEIARLKGLENLNLLQNRITSIPSSIGELTRLKTLVLGYNKLKEIPDTIGGLKKLDYLSLGSNCLARLPQTIGDLVSLEALNLDFNQLQTLPDSISQLVRLKRLSLEHNPFVSLPSCLAKMDGIQDLSIEAGKRSLFMDWSYPHSEKLPQKELSDLSLLVSPSSDLYPSLVESIRESGLMKVSESIIGVARQAVEITSTEPDDYAQPGCSRFGGFPDLADACLFPKTEGLHWIFLAQLNLAELAPFNSHLPRTGLLSFFVDSTESLNARVLLHEGAPSALRTVRHGGADEMTSPECDYTQKAHRVRFERFFSLPYNPPESIEDDNAYEIYFTCDSLRKSVDHHINGHTFTQHESPQEQAANKLRGKPEEWVPLLQLGWDSNVGFCFWDAGTLAFCIHQEDLRRHDFSNVHVSLESS